MTIPGLDEAQEIVGRMKITVEMEPDQWYHLTNPENGRTSWTAIERPLVPPKSLGEACLDASAEMLSEWAFLFSAPPDMYGGTFHCFRGKQIQKPWAIWRIRPLEMHKEMYALRRMLYARHLTYDEKCAMWPSVMK